MKNFLKPTKLKRILFFVLADTAAILFCFFISFYLRLGFKFPEEYHELFVPWAFGLILATIAALSIFDIYNINWRYVGLVELKNIIKAMVVTVIIVYSANLLIRRGFSEYSLPKGVLVIELFLSFTSIAFLRLSKRLFYIFIRGIEGNPTMIIGINYSGERLVKDLASNSREGLAPRVIICEDSTRDKTKIHGIPVYVGLDGVPCYIEKYRIKTVLLNLSDSSRKKTKRIFEMVQKLGINDIRVVPSVKNYDSDVYSSVQFKKLSISDLLFRKPVQIDTERVGHFLERKTVLVTGAAGSIGSEIVRQLINFKVSQIVAFEIDETEIFELRSELSNVINDKGIQLDFVLGDIRDSYKLDQLFDQYRPDIVFHASAYKHVPILETFPAEGVKTNILGTYNLIRCAEKYQCQKVINISTDKAVNPSSIMGATKRIAEMIGRSYNGIDMKVISVRFGNVLGSRGSVIPLFLKQIEQGGPLTLTHMDMKRYFMSIPEAVLLVFQAAFMGNGGEVFVLDMGEPIKIHDLAKSLIKLNNMTLDEDIEIQFTGIRPGEKLFEELLTAEEGTDQTDHDEIYIARGEMVHDREALDQIIRRFSENLQREPILVELIRDTVPSNTIAAHCSEDIRA